VDQGKISAKLRQGVLMLELPRAEKAEPRQIPVQVEGAQEAAKQESNSQESTKAAA
jgi:hypothetical protein